MDTFTKPMNYRQFIKFLIPSVLTMVFLSFYTTIDGFFVSRYAGSDALAGINIVIPITCIIFGISVMLATGSSAIIGELMGRNENERAYDVFSLTATALLIFSIVFAVAGIIFLRPVAVLLGTSERLMPHVLPYLFVTFIGTGAMAFKLFFEYLVRTDGSSETGLIMSFIGLVLNVVLDYIFVGILDLGTFGAAVGTILSIGASAVIGFIYFLKNSHIKFRRPKWNGQTLWKACSNGCSEMFTEFSTGITTFLFNIIIIKEFGEDGVAAVTIIMYIYYFFIAFYMGISVATAPVVSYNLGADNKPKIVEMIKYSFVTIASTAVIIMTVIIFAGDLIIGIFSDPGNVFDLTSNALHYFSPLFIFIGINVFMSGYFTALGDGLTSAVISTLRSLIFVVIYIFILPPVIGVNGVWLTMPLAELTTLFVSLYMYNKKGRPDLLPLSDNPKPVSKYKSI